LSNLDAGLRQAMRLEIRSLQRRRRLAVLYVTHDQAEALSMSNLVAVMRAGEVVQVGTPREIYNEPATTFVAEFVGSINRFTGRVTGNGAAGLAIDTPVGRVVSSAANNAVHLAVGDSCEIIVRPEQLEVLPAAAAAAARSVSGNTVLAGKIARSVFYGQYVYTEVDINDVLVRAHVHPTAEFRRGEDVVVSFPSAQIRIFEAADDRSDLGWKRPSETGSAEIDDYELDLHAAPSTPA
jgi:iron(III) transport system ATP-binding protein